MFAVLSVQRVCNMQLLKSQCNPCNGIDYSTLPLYCKLRTFCQIQQYIEMNGCPMILSLFNLSENSKNETNKRLSPWPFKGRPFPLQAQTNLHFVFEIWQDVAATTFASCFEQKHIKPFILPGGSTLIGQTVTFIWNISPIYVKIANFEFCRSLIAQNTCLIRLSRFYSSNWYSTCTNFWVESVGNILVSYVLDE